MTTLHVRFCIPITEQFNEGLLFQHWLPSDSETLTTRRENLSISVWVDPMRFQVGAFPADALQLAQAGDIRVGKIGVDVRVPDVPDDLAAYVHAHANDDHAAREAAAGQFKDSYEALGRSVMAAATEVLQGVLTFFRVIKGQFWIPQLRFDPENMAGFCALSSAVVRSEAWDWVRWKPSLVGIVRSEARDWGWRRLRQGDWTELHQFVQATKKPPVALELLAESERLEQDGSTRLALIESVAALEVAVRQYLATRPRGNHEALLDDLQLSSVDALFEKLGLRGTLAVLLPLLLSDQELPRDLLRISIKAVELRGVVVHRGKRMLSSGEVRPLLHGLRAASMRLIELATAQSRDRLTE
ncbi:MAG: hypothetical protein LAP61_29710 [Acidobacteriia bacterium]|nr:hypothetical protein [Terriglobia bacterium]